MPEQIDGIDAKILHLIQSNAALSVADIADSVGLSSSPCWRRIKRMEETGIIKQRCLLYTSPSPRDKRQSRMPSSA